MQVSGAVSILQAGLTALYLPGQAQCLIPVGAPQILFKMHFLTLLLLLSGCQKECTGERGWGLGLEPKAIGALGSAFGMGLLFHLGKSLDLSGPHFSGGLSNKVTCLALKLRTGFELIASRKRNLPFEAEISSRTLIFSWVFLGRSPQYSVSRLSDMSGFVA